MKKIANWSLLIILIAIVVQVLLISSEPVNIKSLNEPILSGLDDANLNQKPDQRVEQSLKGLHLVETKDEVREWELWSDEALVYQNSDEWVLDRVKVKFFTESGGVFDVTGQKGEVSTESKNLSITGNVLTKTSNGYHFYSEEILYDSQKRRFYSNKPVRVIGPADAKASSLIFVGNSIDSNFTQNLIFVNDGVQAEKTLSDQRRMIIQSERVELSGVDDSVKFLGKVIIDVDYMRVTGPEAKFYYDKENKVLNRVQVLGGVRVSDVDKWATAKKLDVFLNEDKFVFSGGPKLVQNNDELVGDKIIFYDRGQRVKIHNVKAKVDRSKLESSENESVTN